MRTGFIIIVLIFLASLGYLIWHLWRITPCGWLVKLMVVALFLLWMALAFSNMGLSEKVSIRTASVMADVGYPWMIAFLYLVIIFIFADVLALCKVLPDSLLSNSAAGLLGVCGVIAIILIAGGINYRQK